MSFEKELLDQIKEHEGLILFPYKCPAGKLTIGYGHNIEDNGITLACANYILEEDIEEAIRNLHIVFGQEFFEKLSDPKKIALVDMMFNLGLSKFLTFKKFIKAVKERNWDKASVEMIHSKAYIQAKRRYQLLAEQILG